MKKKSLINLVIVLFIYYNAHSQVNETDMIRREDEKYNLITSAVPFLTIAPDAFNSNGRYRCRNIT